MIVCIQYKFYPKPIWGESKKPFYKFVAPIKYSEVNFRTSNHYAIEAICAWKIKTKK